MRPEHRLLSIEEKEMIKFNADNKLIWKHLNPSSAQTYINFLNCEKARHLVERALTDGKSLEALPKNKLLSELWRSAHKRHIQDIAECEKLIREVKEHFGIE